MSFSRDIIQDLQNELQSKKDQKAALLSQLTLLDARIDKYDELISNIDEDALKIIDIINPKVTAVKAAYDARIAANCKSDLIWEKTEEFEPPYYRGLNVNDKLYRYEVKKNSNTYSFTPYRGLKYYQKPLNRDYGANIITTFNGSISTGSTVLTILDNNTSLTQTIQIGDTIVDNLDNPLIFSSTNLPSVIGFGTTSAVGIVTTLVGGISTGSTIFAHYGPGISSVGIDTGMFFECVGIVTTTIVGFGTTTFTINALNQNGVYEPYSIPCDSIVLKDPAVKGTIEEIFTVGILTTYSSMFISTVSLGNTANSVFTVIRPGDIDTNFDYRQNPSNPLNIGIINSSTVGVGHSIALDASGNPNETVSWNSGSSYFDFSTNTQVNPEPLIGGGRADYYIGTNAWPVIITCVENPSTEIVSCSSTIVPEGTVAITSSTSPAGIGSTNSYPGVDPNGTLCNQLQTNIDTALADLDLTLSQYESQINPLVNATKALRGDRDRKELQAWSILQALGSITEDIKRLETDIQSLINTDFSSYETS